MKILVLTSLLLAPLSVAASADPLAPSAAVFNDIGKDQPGCSAGVARQGKQVWSGGFGLADLASKRPADDLTIYNIASMSKQVTALAIFQLESAGKLKIDDSIRTYLPEMGAYAQRITIRNLLHHNHGLIDYIKLARFAGIKISDPMTKQQGLDLIFRQTAAEFPPGEEFRYSNSGYFLLAVIVERVTGRSMKDYAADNIFKPLGLKDTRFVDSYPLELPRLARGYRNAGADGWQIDETGWEMTGDGQVHTTIRDFLVLQDNLATGRVGGLKMVGRLRERGRLNDGELMDYAAGLVRTDFHGVEQFGHGGGWAGYESYSLWLPERSLNVAVMCNTHGLNPYQRALRLAALWAGPTKDVPLPFKIPSRVTTAALQPASQLTPGVYASEDGTLMELIRMNGGIGLRMEGSDFPLSSEEKTLAGDYFDRPIVIASPAADRFVTSRYRGTFNRLVPWTPSSLTPFEGSFRLRTTPGELKIVRNGERLYLHLGGNEESLTPVAFNRFRAGDEGLVTFSPDLSSVTVNNVRGVIFDRERSK